jgi:hypothetical protein
MNQSNESPPREPFFLPTRQRATPVVETPSRWPHIAMAVLYALAFALAIYLFFRS